MTIEQIYTGCLAQGAYYITSNGEAAIIDPLREINPYLERAAKENVKIKYIFETHFHADFVSGHIDLAKATGATIIYGPTAKPYFAAHIATDGEIFTLGSVQFKTIHTPGHTMESTCYLLIDEDKKDIALFTGDTLFIGDVGRPDLAQKAAHLTQEELAAILYKSLRTKVMTLADHVIVYPAHGAGSACGKNMSKETVSTIGNQKLHNYALRENMTQAEFVKEVTDGLMPPPIYFPLNVAMNKNGYESIDLVLARGLNKMNTTEFEIAANETNALILDTRNAQVFSEGFVPIAYIGLDGQFAPWVGALIPDIKQPILLITEDGNEEEAITRLARVGYDNIIGYLNGGFIAWKNKNKEIDFVNRMPVEELETILNSSNPILIDLRQQIEYDAGHIKGAINIPLSNINSNIAQFSKANLVIIYCAGGYRSMIAASILKSRGWDNFADVIGGFAEICKSNIATSVYVCPST